MFDSHRSCFKIEGRLESNGLHQLGKLGGGYGPGPFLNGPEDVGVLHQDVEEHAGKVWGAEGVLKTRSVDSSQKSLH